MRPESFARCGAVESVQFYMWRQSWRTSTVIPIPNPAKDASDPNNYRPIVLTDCLCKVMELMVKNRLVWFLKRNS